MTELVHITVCVCTYKRPQFLRLLLEALRCQTTNQQFTYSIVIVDNDSERSGKQIVDEFQSKNTVMVLYCNESVQNIALARNKALDKSKGTFVAFIDDDETPIERWLLLLYETMRSYKAVGILGPVLPCFQEQPPTWIVKGKLCERKRFPTGTYIESASDTRTGNILLSKEFLDSHGFRFDPKFGLTGGEDCDLFRRMMEKGAEFVWCDEACVHEVVPSSRLTRRYLLKRALLRGVANSHGVHFFSKSAGRSMLAMACYTSALPLLIVAGHHHFMRFLIKTCDHLGKVIAVVGIKVLVKRQM